MENLEFCCNPFKQRNHNPQSWRLLPVTKSLRDQFRLYLGDDTDICISCKRKLYCTLPTTNNEETFNDSTHEETDESIQWSDGGKIETRELNEVCDYLPVEDHYYTYQLAKQRQADIKMAHEQAEDVPEDNKDVTKTEANSGAVTHEPNSQNTQKTQVMETTENYTSWYNST